MSAHTPGPWVVEPRVYPNQCDSIFGPNDAPIANMIGDSEANARLISAAPELLAALEAMVKATDAYSVHGEDCSRTEECDEARDNPSDCAPHGCLDSKEDDCPSCECGITAIVLANEKARAAIAKARGEA